MKVSTITCHEVYNHGASLQAYALQKHLIKMGMDSQIINYKPTYLSQHYKILSINNPKWEKNLLFKMIYLGFHMPSRILGLKRKRAFDKFTLKYLNVTKETFTSVNQLIDNIPNSDAYICGSDQIWNCLHQNGKDPSFYLSFVPDNKIKFSYAASFATDSIPDNYKNLVKTRVKNLQGVAVRESSAVKILNDLNIKAVNVVDPVFLLDREEWSTLTQKNNKEKEKYILIYDFDDSSLIKKIAIEIKNKTGLKIYTINQSKLKYFDKYFINKGPETFVDLIRNAEYVISNSYHAAVFSIIFERNFFIVNRNESINTRMRDMLNDLKLSSRLINNEYDSEDLLTKINYKETKVILENKISFSKEYLRKNLSDL